MLAWLLNLSVFVYGVCDRVAGHSILSQQPSRSSDRPLVTEKIATLRRIGRRRLSSVSPHRNNSGAPTSAQGLFSVRPPVQTRNPVEWPGSGKRQRERSRRRCADARTTRSTSLPTFTPPQKNLVKVLSAVVSCTSDGGNLRSGLRLERTLIKSIPERQPWMQLLGRTCAPNHGGIAGPN